MNEHIITLVVGFQICLDQQQKNNSLFVPAAVMNKVFDLFILDVYLNTLRGEKRRDSW